MNNIEVSTNTQISMTNINTKKKRRIFEQQNNYRNMLIQKYGKCVVSNSNRNLCDACHIKPYRKCSEFEQFDPNNGLLMARYIHMHFDNYNATIDSVTLEFIVGEYVTNKKMYDELLQYNKKCIIGSEYITQETREYLKYHNNAYNDKQMYRKIKNEKKEYALKKKESQIYNNLEIQQMQQSSVATVNDLKIIIDYLQKIEQQTYDLRISEIPNFIDNLQHLKIACEESQIFERLQNLLENIKTTNEKFSTSFIKKTKTKYTQCSDDSFNKKKFETKYEQINIDDISEDINNGYYNEMGDFIPYIFRMPKRKLRKIKLKRNNNYMMKNTLECQTTKNAEEILEIEDI